MIIWLANLLILISMFLLGGHRLKTGWLLNVGGNIVYVIVTGYRGQWAYMALPLAGGLIGLYNLWKLIEVKPPASLKPMYIRGPISDLSRLELWYAIRDAQFDKDILATQQELFRRTGQLSGRLNPPTTRPLFRMEED